MQVELARKCKEIRQESGISVDRWAYNLGLKKEQIVSFEKGITAIPTLVLMEYAKLKKENERKNKDEKKCKHNSKHNES